MAFDQCQTRSQTGYILTFSAAADIRGRLRRVRTRSVACARTPQTVSQNSPWSRPSTTRFRVAPGT